MVTVRVTLQEVINAPTAVINDTTNKVNKNRFIEFHFIQKIRWILFGPKLPKITKNFVDSGVPNER